MAGSEIQSRGRCQSLLMQKALHGLAFLQEPLQSSSCQASGQSAVSIVACCFDMFGARQLQGGDHAGVQASKLTRHRSCPAPFHKAAAMLGPMPSVCGLMTSYIVNSQAYIHGIVRVCGYALMTGPGAARGGRGLSGSQGVMAQHSAHPLRRPRTL